MALLAFMSFESVVSQSRRWILAAFIEVVYFLGCMNNGTNFISIRFVGLMLERSWIDDQILEQAVAFGFSILDCIRYPIN